MRLHTNTRDLDDLGKKFKAASRNQRREFRRGLKEAGEIVADDARARIADVSPKTAESIKVGARGVSAVEIRAGHSDLPIARLLEGKGVDGYWSHPLFGDRSKKYAEQRHPYLWPAYLEHAEEVKRKLNEAIDRGLSDSGIETE